MMIGALHAPYDLQPAHLRRITFVALGKDGIVVRQLRTLFNVGAVRELTDGQLLERFAAGPGEAAERAFAVLVERHGPMVLRVCRGVLTDAHDTQDAFQATFLVLVKKARGLWVRDSLGPWLHQVAFRTAACARTAAARRRRLDRRAALFAAQHAGTPAEPRDELGRMLHEEVERLPEWYRAPLVLCDLQGLSHEQAARCLGLPVGTVKSRLARGRQRLRDRLVRRGLTPDAGLLATLPVPAGPDALLPAALIDATAGAAARFLTARTIAPGSALFLAQGVLRSMFLLRWLKLASIILVLGTTASGLGLLARRGTVGAAAHAQENPRPASSRGDDGPGTAVAVQPGKFRVTVAARGLVEATENQDVFSKVEGRTTLISILPEGSYVKKGQLVAELDSSGFQDRLRNQRIATLGAEALYHKARHERQVAEMAVTAYVEGSYKQELEKVLGDIAAARSAIPKTEARLARTRRASQRLNDMLSAPGKNATAAEIVAGLDLEDRIDVAEQTLARETRELERAETARQVLQKYTRDKTAEELQGEAEKAKSDELARQLAWELEKDKETRLEHQIQNCKLLAPGDGMVEYASASGPDRIEEGWEIRERQKIFSLPNIRGPMRVNAKVPEAWVDKVRPGYRVQIKVDAFVDVVLAGTVQAVFPLPDANSFARSGTKVYTTHVTIDKGLGGLRPGMSASAEILIAELENAITVPVGALLKLDGKYHVVVQKPDGGFDWRPVTLGMSNDERIEIKQGLQSGERVIQDPRSLMSEEAKRAKKPGTPAREP
jgi:RND family efflux transporter MFP subunit